ncbi:hypothetical protein B0H14DRAFT_3123145 [Mycena olivaceomarginata]|nr:hypothetical protein B0H14DRAFT_3123145 [Mycena olivaceomarginata]
MLDPHIFYFSHVVICAFQLLTCPAKAHIYPTSDQSLRRRHGIELEKTSVNWPGVDLAPLRPTSIQRHQSITLLDVKIELLKTQPSSSGESNIADSGHRVLGHPRNPGKEFQRPATIDSRAVREFCFVAANMNGRVHDALSSKGKKMSRTIASSGPAGQLPTSSVVPLLVDRTGALNTATAQLSTNAPGDQGANDEDLANLINEILDITIGQDVNTALNKLVPKLGLDGLLTPVPSVEHGGTPAKGWKLGLCSSF